jgi:hypothetical protein
LRKEKEEREKTQRAAPPKPGSKLSKPEPARSPFLFFKEANPKLDAEQLKAAWAALPENEKQVRPEISKLTLARFSRPNPKRTSKEKRRRKKSGQRHKP